MGGVGLGWGVRVDVNEIEVFVKIQKKNFFWGGGVRWGGGSVAEWVRWGGWGWLGGGQGGCERNVGGRGWMWGMGDVNQE